MLWGLGLLFAPFSLGNGGKAKVGSRDQGFGPLPRGVSLRLWGPTSPRSHAPLLMNLRKADDFIADVERQFEWYVLNSDWETADRYLAAVDATCALLGRHPFLGPPLKSKQSRLQNWRFFVVFRPFNKHIIFYEIIADELVMRRSMHGNRDLLRRLTEPPP